MCAVGGASTRPDAADGRVVSDAPYVLPSFEKAEGVDYFVDRAGYERALAEGLRHAGRVYELEIFDGDNHVLRAH